jgi:uncharacterized protein (DUF433 family)
MSWRGSAVRVTDPARYDVAAPPSPTIDLMAFDRITADPATLEGKPCIRGLRISVETVVRLVAAGWSFEEILDEYPDLQREDITQGLEYAAAATNVHHYQLREPA